MSTPRGRVYTFTARPPQARSCVLVCSSIFGDFSANYYRERLLGQALVDRGIGVIRFHYVGEGNSEGERSGMTFSSLCEDAAAVLDHAEFVGFSEFAVLGTRVGALVAAATVSSRPGVPLVLWEPVTEPRRFITEALRARRMSQMAQGDAGSTTDWRQELEEKGMLDLVGYELYPPLLESLERVDLLSALGTEPRRAFIVRFRGKPGASDPLAEALRERGISVESDILELSESWWFHSETVPETGDLITATTTWFSNELSEKV